MTTLALEVSLRLRLWSTRLMAAYRYAPQHAIYAPYSRRLTLTP